MNLLNLFRKVLPVETVTQAPSADEITLRLMDVEAAIAAGEGDVAALMREARELRDQQAAARVKEQQEQQREYTRNLEAQQKAIADAYAPDVQELLDLLPRVVLACAGLRTTQEKYPEWWGAHSRGLPYQFPRDLVQMILRDSGVEFDYSGSNHAPKQELGVQFADRRPARRVEGNITFVDYE